MLKHRRTNFLVDALWWSHEALGTKILKTHPAAAKESFLPQSPLVYLSLW